MFRNTAIALVIFIILRFSLSSQVVDPYYPFGTQTFIKSEKLYDDGLLRKAESELLDGINRFPDNASADKSILLKANIEYIAGNLKIADKILSEFIDERSNSPLISYASLLRAYFAFDKMNYPKAEKLFTDAKKISEKEAAERNDTVYSDMAHKALFWQGISMALQGRYQDAEPIFSECFQKYPTKEFADDALFALGIIAEMNKSYDAAINYYNTISKKYPYCNNFIASRVREANNRLVNRDVTMAFVVIENAQNKLAHIRNQDSIGLLYEKQSYAEHASEDLLYLQAEAFNHAGKFDEALIAFNSFLETFSESPLKNYARLGAGWAQLNKGKYNDAIKYYKDVINSNDNSDPQLKSIALLYRTIALKKSGDVAQAKKDFISLAAQPSYMYLSQVELELGQMQYEAGEYADAQKSLERAERESKEAITSVRIHLLLGDTYLELNTWEKAVAEFKLAEQLASKSSYIIMPAKDWYIAESRLKQGIALIKSHRNSEAIPLMLAFMAENNKDNRADEALFWLGEAYYRSELLRNSAETYQNLLELFPKSKRREEAIYGLGWSYFRLKNFEKSSETFDKMITEFPKSKFALEVLSRQGDGYYITKDFKKAALAYQKAAKAYPNTEEGQYCAYQMCHAYYRQNMLEEAVTNLLSFVKKYPNSSFAPFALYLNGWIRFQQQNYNEAIDDFKYLIQAYSQTGLVVRAYYAIGDAYYNLGSYEKAIESYKFVIENYPSNPLAGEAMKSLQYCLMALGRKDEAMQIADNFITTNPGSPFAEEFKFKRAEMFYTGKKYSDAITEYENFIKSHPDNEKSAEAMFWMGKSYVNTNDFDKAESSFRDIGKRYPKSDYVPLSLLELALLKKQIGQINKADSVFRVLQNQFPTHQAAAQAGFERAIIYFAMADTNKALNTFRDVIEKFKGMDYADQSRYQIAMYYKSKEKNDSAMIEFNILAKDYENIMLAAESQYRIGEIYMRDKIFEKAIEAFSIVKEKFAGNEDWYSKSLLNLGECFEQTGNNDAAAETYKVLESIRPDDDYGKTAKSRLKRLNK